MSLAQLVRCGRAGLCISNVKTLKSEARETVHPLARIDKLLPPPSSQMPLSTGAALRRCSDTMIQSFDSTSVVKEMADDLFPVAQGVHESASMSSCLLYAIEF